MGAEFDADLVLDRCGRSQTEGGLNVTLRDLARFGELHRLGGHGIVPADWIADVLENGDADAWDRGSMSAIMPGHYYRSQWYVDLGSTGRPFMAIGAFGQSVFVDRANELVIAKLSCFAPDQEDLLFGDMFRAFDAISRAFAVDRGARV
jgi:hypothetical protein